MGHPVHVFFPILVTPLRYTDIPGDSIIIDGQNVFGTGLARSRCPDRARK